MSADPLDRVLTQYRESPRLLGIIDTYVDQVKDVYRAVEEIPSHFDIDTAIGDQLTIIGKILGWPRSHCACEVMPLYGFACEDNFNNYPIVDFCDPSGSWEDCGEIGVSNIVINDDELYRKFLKARRYQMMGLYDLESLIQSVKALWGENATIPLADNGRVLVMPGRDLTTQELQVVQLYPRVLPVFPGIKINFQFSSTNIFGFGYGWGGLCETNTDWLCEYYVSPYECN